jgi:hypothetical protein
MKYILVTLAMSLCACTSPGSDPYAIQAMPSTQMPPHIQHRYDPVQCNALAHQCQNGNYREWEKLTKQQRKQDKEGVYRDRIPEPVGCSCAN